VAYECGVAAELGFDDTFKGVENLQLGLGLGLGFDDAFWGVEYLATNLHGLREAFGARWDDKELLEGEPGQTGLGLGLGFLVMLTVITVTSTV